MINVMLFVGEITFLDGNPIFNKFEMRTLSLNEIITYQKKMESKNIIEDLQKEDKIIIVNESEEEYVFASSYKFEVLFSPEVIPEICEVIKDYVSKLK